MTKPTKDSALRSFGEDLFNLACDGRRRAQGRRRLMQRLDQQITALRHATDAADIETRVRPDTERLIAFTDLLLSLGTLSSLRDPTQHRRVEEKLTALKTELARAVAPQRQALSKFDA